MPLLTPVLANVVAPVLFCTMILGSIAQPGQAGTPESHERSRQGSTIYTAYDLASEDGGPIAPYDPNQVRLEEPFSVEWNDYEIEATHGFGIEALVMSRKDYREGDLGALIPMDLALAWGKASDRSWVKHLRVKQEDRLYIWSFPGGTEISAEVLIAHSANMHIIPPNPQVAAQLRNIRKGDLVRLSGFLVNLHGPEGLTIKTSLVRTDTGRGACELILLEGVEIVR